RGRLVNSVLERRNQASVSRRIGPGRTRWGHYATPQLPDDLFPHLRIRRNARGVENRQRQSAALRLLVMASEGISLQGRCSEFHLGRICLRGCHTSGRRAKNNE